MSDTKQAPASNAPAAAPPKKKMSTLVKAYLILYNAASTVLWAGVLGRTILTTIGFDASYVYFTTSVLARWTQTLAALEILHVLVGIVRTSLITTIMQVASRYLLVWLVVYPFPAVARSTAYATMLGAWSLTEVIRYQYFALMLAESDAQLLAFLRYSTFLVLYPTGILSECWLIWLAASNPDNAAAVHPLLPYVFYFILFVVYPPGSVHMFSHMWSQRAKVLGKAAKRASGKKDE